MTLDSIDPHKRMICTVRKKRIILSNVDNERYALDSVHSLPYGFKEETIPKFTATAYRGI